MYTLFLNHPEGITSDDLVLHWKELCRIYSKESLFADSEFREDKIESLCAESKTVFYATVSRIKRKFCDAVGNLNAESFIIKKRNGSNRDNGVVIDAASEEIMLRIENEMSRLKVMGDDDSRYFWIWAQTNNRERKWLRLRTAH